MGYFRVKQEAVTKKRDLKRPSNSTPSNDETNRVMMKPTILSMKDQSIITVYLIPKQALHHLSAWSSI